MPASPVIAQTPRLTLSLLTLEDAPFILQLVNDAQWLAFIGDKGVRTLYDARAYLRDGPLTMYAQHGHGLYRVALRDSGNKGDRSAGPPVGICGLVRRAGLDDADIGFALPPAHRGQGYALEAARAVLEHGFGALDLPRIVAITLPHNAPSRRLLEGLGMNLQRTLHLPADGPEKLLYALERPAGAAPG
jgi:ribosomal-protein-alanine N-acetyltransferase